MIRTMVQAQSACLSPACLSSQYSEATTLSSVREFIVWSQQWQTFGSRLWERSHLARNPSLLVGYQIQVRASCSNLVICIVSRTRIRSGSRRRQGGQKSSNTMSDSAKEALRTLLAIVREWLSFFSDPWAFHSSWIALNPLVTAAIVVGLGLAALLRSRSSRQRRRYILGSLIVATLAFFGTVFCVFDAGKAALRAAQLPVSDVWPTLSSSCVSP
jgi:hypothetical protein